MNPLDGGQYELHGSIAGGEKLQGVDSWSIFFSAMRPRFGKKDMSTIIPHGEAVRRAFAYLTEERAAYPERSLSALLDETGSRYNLSPLDCAALERLLSAPENDPANGSLSD